VTFPLRRKCAPGLKAELEDFLKGLGHAILGNFSTEKMVMELTKIKITAQNYRRTQTKHRKAKKRQG